MSAFGNISKEQARESAQFFATRVGLEVADVNGKAYWITDVVDDRLRVLDEHGVSFWFDERRRVAAPIRELKPEWRALGEQITKRKTRRP